MAKYTTAPAAFALAPVGSVNVIFPVSFTRGFSSSEHLTTNNMVISKIKVGINFIVFIIVDS
jgi:hypothetical protein